MKSLYESILNPAEVMKKSDKTVFGEWMAKTFKGTYKTVRLKNGAYKVWGDLIIRGLNVDSFNNIPIKIASLEGNLYIEDCPNITDLSGLFYVDLSTKIKGNIHITNCKNLNSLIGAPDWIEGELSIIDCKNLKSLDGAPSLVYDVTLMKNGKRWSEKSVRDKIRNVINVNCSEVEPDGELITEAFSEPNLIKFFDWLNKEYHRMQKEGPSYDYYTSKDANNNYKIPKVVLSKVIPNSMELSKLRPSDVTVYSNSKDKVTTIRSAINKSIKSGCGFVIVQNATTDSYEYIFGPNCDVINLRQWRFDGKTKNISWSGRRSYGEQWGIQGIMDLAGDAKGNRANPRNFIIVHARSAESVSRHKLRDDRKESRAGMPWLTKPDFHALGYKTKEEQEYQMKNYLQRLVRENKDRWNKMIIVLRAKKKAAEYDRVCELTGKVIERFSKLPAKMSVAKGKSALGGDTGLLNIILDNLKYITSHLPEMVDFAHHIEHPGTYYPTNSPDYCARQAENYRESIVGRLSIIDNALKKFGV